MIDEAVDITAARRLSAKDHAAWQIVHGILAFGDDLKLEHDGGVVPALSWLLYGGEINGWRFRQGDHGLDTVVEPGSKSGQGHEDQWLGYLSQREEVGLDHPITVRIGNQLRTYKVNDLLTQAQWDVHEPMEATWTLMALSTFVKPIEASWKAKDGSRWTVERVLAMEASQDLKESACGGSHRLCAIVMALNRYRNEKRPKKLTGGWLKAQQVVGDSVATIKAWQQPDGSFSSSYFQRPSSTPNVAQRLSTTGHTLEFLTLALSDRELQEPWVVKSAVLLCELVQQTREMPVECGGLYHTAHGLQIYRLRRFGPRVDEKAVGKLP